LESTKGVYFLSSLYSFGFLISGRCTSACTCAFTLCVCVCVCVCVCMYVCTLRIYVMKFLTMFFNVPLETIKHFIL
jgi:hypothetical protein